MKHYDIALGKGYGWYGNEAEVVSVREDEVNIYVADAEELTVDIEEFAEQNPDIVLDDDEV